MKRHYLLIPLMLFACESAHPASETVQSFADALQYGDRAALFAGHVDSTDQGEFCRSEFRKLLEKAQAEVRTEDCQRVRSLTTTDLGAMADELRLAVQVTGWSCENQKGSCVDYAKTVFDQALDEHPLTKQKPKSVEVRRVFGDESSAAAYLDITSADGGVEHRTLKLKKVGVGWRVTQGFLAE